ncbi:MAG: hypothetical protein K0S47_3767 [Herbinix sp.]|jgi:hypothetical protein|nr:hypothetical protein [Herbinix sp.]
MNTPLSYFLTLDYVSKYLYLYAILFGNEYNWHNLVYLNNFKITIQRLVNNIKI